MPPLRLPSQLTPVRELGTQSSVPNFTFLPPPNTVVTAEGEPPPKAFRGFGRKKLIPPFAPAALAHVGPPWFEGPLATARIRSVPQARSPSSVGHLRTLALPKVQVRLPEVIALDELRVVRGTPRETARVRLVPPELGLFLVLLPIEFTKTSVRTKN